MRENERQCVEQRVDREQIERKPDSAKGKFEKRQREEKNQKERENKNKRDRKKTRKTECKRNEITLMQHEKESSFAVQFSKQEKAGRFGMT